MLQDQRLPLKLGASAMPRRPFPFSPDLFPDIVHALEVAIVAASGVLLFLMPSFYREEYISQHLFFVAFVALSYKVLSDWSGLGHINALMRPLTRLDNVIIAMVTSFLFFLTVIYGLDVSFLYDWRFEATFFTVALCGVVAIRLSAYSLLKLLSARGAVGRNLVVLGAGPQAARLLRKMAKDPPYFTEVAGVFAAAEEATGPECEGAPVLGGIDELLCAAREGMVDDVVIALPWSADRKVIETIERLKELPLNVYLGSDLVGFDLAFRPVLGAFSQMPVFEVVQRPIAGWGSAVKTVFDFIFASAALLALSPLLLLVALAIKLDTPGPVLFRQDRLGFNNKPFAIYKFRSMHHNCDAVESVAQATRNDPRVTRVGRIIRATSIDELPQLLNVLNGTMSLVGPRPHAMSHNEEYGAVIRGYFARHKVKPGITGWAQVNGLRGETVEIEMMKKRVEHDVYYAENWSFSLDIKILIMTVLVVLFQKTAY